MGPSYAALSDGVKDPEEGRGRTWASSDVSKTPRALPIDGTTLSLLAALSYGATSMAMVFINKAVLLQYPCSMTLLTLQQLATALLIHFGKVMGLTKAQDLNFKSAKKLFWLSIFYNANVAFALASLKGVNIPMYIALKRLTPLGVLVAGCFYGRGKPSLQVILSVSLTALGVIIAALGDFSFDLLGYCLALSSVFFQTAYLLLVEISGADDGLSSIELMLYNSVLSLPFLVFLVIVTKEVPNSLVLLFDKASSFNFTVLLVVSLVMGIALNYTMFLCTMVNSALTTTIVGVLKGVGTTDCSSGACERNWSSYSLIHTKIRNRLKTTQLEKLVYCRANLRLLRKLKTLAGPMQTLGFFLLGGVRVQPLNVTGLFINTSGGVWYSLAKYYQKQKKKLGQVK